METADFHYIFIFGLQPCNMTPCANLIILSAYMPDLIMCAVTLLLTCVVEYNFHSIDLYQVHLFCTIL